MKRGLAHAAQSLAGRDVAGVCAVLQRWRERGDGELPWLAGPAFTAMGTLGLPPPDGEHVTTVERFLIGAETDPSRLTQAMAALADLSVTVTLPPDFRGALVESVDRFYEVLAEAYAALHDEVLAGHRRSVEDLIEQWQPQIDDAAHDISERIQVLSGTPRTNIGPPRRRQSDRAGVAMAFVMIALLVAATVMWMVMQGWPMESVDFGI